ncbi:MAG: beta-lactamase family protein, partial [Calditrichaeota bacterium]|nr:beta-lactamase family protein [Calditrichota bacterium]
MTINYMMLIFALSVSSAQINKFTEELDLYFKAVVAPSEPGISVLIMKSGKEIYGAGYGIADLESREKITNQTVFNTGSISKTFVAYGILLLADDGKINLDD